jgi:Zn-dependent protease/CBS domain-containing protein
MKRGIVLGKLFGIEIILDWSVLVIFGLLVYQLGGAVFPAWHPEWSPSLSWAVAVAAALVFLSSIVAHELAHSLVGRRYGITVRTITLFLFGGVASMENEPPSARSEFWMAIAGPIASLLIGLSFTLAGGWLAGPVDSDDPTAFFAGLGPAATILAWVGPVNLLLAFFNMIPGFPLDGGRVLRAVLWRVLGDLTAATRVASTVGRVIAWLLIFGGVASALGRPPPGLAAGLGQGLWLIFIGFFLNNAARESYRHVLTEQLLSGVRVARLMARSPAVIAADLPIGLLIDAHLLGSDARAFPVVDDDQRLIGLVCLEDVRKIPRDRWLGATVAEIMTPLADLAVIGPEEPAVAGLRLLARREVGQLPVVQHGRLVGLLRRSDVMRWLELNAEALAA